MASSKIKNNVKQENEKNRLKGLAKVKSRDLMKVLNKEYETARLRKLSKEDREKSLNKIFELCKGDFVKLSFKRNSAKIMQCLIKYGNDEIINAITSEIQANFSLVLQKSYGHFVLSKLAEVRKKVVFEMVKKELRKNITDKIAIVFINTFYVNLGKKKKNEMLNMLVMSELGIKMDIEFIIRKIIDKKMLEHEITHDILYMHLEACSDAIKKNILSEIKDQIEFLVLSENGLQIAIEITKLDKNDILEKLSGTFMKIMCNKNGSEFLMHMMDICEYNEVQKLIVDKIHLLFSDVFANEYSVKPLLKILKSNKKFKFDFNSELLTFLDENFTDFIRNFAYQVIAEIAQVNGEILKRSIALVENNKENKIYDDEYAKKYFNILQDKKLIDLTKFIQ